MSDRSRGIGGTDAAAILGYSEFRSPHRVWLEKTRREPESDGGSVPGAAQLGLDMEPLILEWYLRKTGREQVTRGRRYESWLSELYVDDVTIWASTDMEVGVGQDTVIVDAKAVSPSKSHEYGPDGSGLCPKGYAVQMMWYLGITGRSWAELAVWFWYRDQIRTIVIPRRQAVIDRLRKRVAAWWLRHVTHDEEPAREYRRPSDQTITVLPEKGKAKTVAPTERLARVIQAYSYASAVETVAKKVKDAAKAELQDLCGDAETMTIADTGIVVERKFTRRAGYVVEPGEYWRMSVKIPKEYKQNLLIPERGRITEALTGGRREGKSADSEVQGNPELDHEDGAGDEAGDATDGGSDRGTTEPKRSVARQRKREAARL